MINRAGKLRAMKPMESGMNVPEPTPARNCIPKNGVRFGDIGARRLEVKKTTMPMRRTLRTPKMPPR
jgi:hypothetical protein